MTNLQLRALQLVVSTDDGDATSTLRFTSGLNILRADNSSGKSTALQSIIYALGLEGMLSARRDIPLAHAMTDRVLVGSSERVVRSSRVRLEIENASSEILTLERVVKDERIDRSLVAVWHGPAITEDGDYTRKDYFVRRSGAAQREAGFHYFLAAFLGWKLPIVTRADGSEVPLYMECIFPYFFVEQKHGWSGIQARIPTYFGIREVGKRSAEFVLGLDYFARVLERQRIASAGAEIEATWQSLVRSLRAVVDEAGAVLAKEPAGIVSGPLPEDVASPRIFVDGDWMEYDPAIARISEKLRAYEIRTEPRNVGDVALEAEVELNELQPRLDSSLATLSLLVEERGEVGRRADEVELRVDALREDLQRHKDALTLQGLGSSQDSSLLADHVCPTCHQEVGEGGDITDRSMTIGENISFVEQQLKMFEGMRADLLRVAAALDARLTGLRSSVSELRQRVRALKRDLVSEESRPSERDISERVTLESRRANLLRTRSEMVELRAELARMSNLYAQNREALKSAQIAELPEGDKRKLASLEKHVRAQLERYHFSSIRPVDVEISPETYRPAHEGFDLGFDLSASDMIRLIWAYLIGILHVGGESNGGQHPGFLVFDEPRQQETAQESYAELLQQAAEEATSGVQLLFATSERRESLLAMMGDARFNLINFDAGTRLIGGDPEISLIGE